MGRTVLLYCCLAALPAWAQDWQMDFGKSQVRFVIKQMNVPVEGGFGRFTVRANLDPAKPESGTLRVDLDAASIDTGTADGNEEARRPLWFDTARHPRASFIGKSVKKQADGRYLATGDLMVKGRGKPVAVPFTMTRQATGAWLVEGRLPVSRADFGIGGGDWNDVVADQADVRFRFWLNP